VARPIRTGSNRILFDWVRSGRFADAPRSSAERLGCRRTSRHVPFPCRTLPAWYRSGVVLPKHPARMPPASGPQSVAVSRWPL